MIARPVGAVLLFLSLSAVGQTRSGPPGASGAMASIAGTVLSLDTATLTLKTSDGKIKSYVLQANTSIIRVSKRSVADLEPGQFVGCLSVASSGATRRATDVHIMSNAERGMGEGHRRIDAGRTMTDGTIDSTTSSLRGKTLKISYQGGSQQIEVSPDTPVASMEPMAREELKPGASLTILMEKNPAGIAVVRTVMIGQIPGPMN